MLTKFEYPNVENFFDSQLTPSEWKTLDTVKSVVYEPQRQAVVIKFEPDLVSQSSNVLLLEFPDSQVLRLRFDPKNKSIDDYPDENSRTIVMDDMTSLRALLDTPSVTVGTVGPAGSETEFVVNVTNSAGNNTIKITVAKTPFKIQVFRPKADGGWYPVLVDAAPSMQFRAILKYDVNGAGSTTEHQIIKRFKKSATARYMGFGEKAGSSLTKNGKQLTFVNYDNWGMSAWYGNGPTEDREPLYNSNPFFLEFNGVESRRSVYGVLLDNTGPAYMDIAAARSDTIQIGVLYDDLDLFFFFGDSTQDVLGLLTNLVGRARLKPRYVLGYHQGCYGYESAEHLNYVIERYRSHEVPIDGLHIDIDIQDHYRTFTVDKNRFDNPKQMFGKLRQAGIKCSTNITPIIAYEHGGYSVFDDGVQNQAFIKDERSSGWKPTPTGETLYRGGVFYGADRNIRGVYPDLGNREVRDWWGKQYNYLFSLGLEMVWQDMTTPCMDAQEFSYKKSFPPNLLLTNDSRKMYSMNILGERLAQTDKKPAALGRNLYAYNLVKATYHGLNNLATRSQDRNFIIARGGFTGMHRFAALWTGDNISDWPYLKLNVLQSIAGGLSGQPIVGADIGGFGARSNEKWADPELLMRWTIAGAFLPWFRNHYSRKDGTKDFQEPWAYLDNKHRASEQDHWLYDAVLPVCRHYIELRYRLMQLFYDAMFENTQTGLPIVRPLFVNDDSDLDLFYDQNKFNNNQWFVGRDLLVAPVLEKQAQENNFGFRKVYLPNHSNWYLFMDNKRSLLNVMKGGKSYDFDAHISTEHSHIGFLCPIFVRAGGIIPTIELEQYVGQRTTNGKPSNPITINIYPSPISGKNSIASYDLYEDDGVSRASAPKPQAGEDPGADPLANSEYRHTRISHKWLDAQNREIRIDRLHDGYSPALNYFFIAVLHDSENSGLACSGQLAQINLNQGLLSQLQGAEPATLADRLWNSQSSCWYFNKDLRISFIKLSAPLGQDVIRLTYL